MHELVEPIGEVGPLRDPVLIAAFSGWNDFGGAAGAAIKHLGDQWKASDLAAIRNERLFDFTVQRPTVRLEGERRVIDWPAHQFRVASPAGAERDFVLLSGPEPHLRWRTFTEAIAELMVEVGATTSITIAAQAGAVPHTRPLPVTLSASDSDFEGQFGLRVPQSRYEGPTGIVGAFNVDQRQRGFRNASLWAQVPHYLSTGPNPNAIAALIKVLDRGFGTNTSLARIERRIERFSEQVQEAVTESGEAESYIRMLEQQYDDNLEQEAARESATDAELPSAEDLLSDLEGFLRDQRDEG
ncbi:MAG: PAC2 family protein [Chloroflexi bacterium]|nr:PAC2 family protein [Chloroflexota bacterium]